MPITRSPTKKTIENYKPAEKSFDLNICQICSSIDSEPELKCMACLLYFHAKCSGISESNQISSYSIKTIFVCPDCHKKMPQYANTSSPPTEARLEQIANKLSDALSQFDSSMIQMRTQYDLKIEDLRVELTDKIDNIAAELINVKTNTNLLSDVQISEKIEPLMNKYAEDKDSEILQLNLKLENLDRLSRLKTLVIRGVPVYENEYLRDMFEQGLCPAVGFNCDKYDVVSIWRQRSTKSKFPPIIVVEFISKEVRDYFFSCYFKAQKLTLDRIGFA